jgi:predicted N-acetyltransferase YhbS
VAGVSSSPIRRANSADRAGLRQLLHDAFEEEPSAPRDFLAYYPHLFTDQRISQHLVFEEARQLVGCVGAYHWPVCWNGVAFDTIGIGQVATHPGRRKRGIMRALMAAATEQMDRADFAWLWGDRLRYARFGFALGGRRRVYTVSEHGLADFAELSPRATVLAADTWLGPVQSALSQLQVQLTMDQQTLAQNLAGKRLHVLGLDGGLSVFSHDGASVLLASGAQESVGGLLLAQARRVGMPLAVQVAAGDQALGGLCRACCDDLREVPSASFRIGDLASFATKLTAHPWFGSAGNRGLRITNTESGEEVTLPLAHCQQTAELVGNRCQLSEALFGFEPLVLTQSSAPAMAPDPALGYLPLNLDIADVYML